MARLTIPSLRRDDPHWFPPVSEAFNCGEYQGLLAEGGDVAPARLLTAYAKGIFPWPDSDGWLQWWAPDPRAVIFCDRVHISKSMRRTLNNPQLRVAWNSATADVIEACSQARSTQNGSWITEDLKSSYMHLSHLNRLESCEVWKGDTLVGGIFGIIVGRVFCGESMFHRIPNASKLALIHVTRRAQFQVIDCQFMTEHLQSMGAEMISLSSLLEFSKS